MRLIMKTVAYLRVSKDTQDVKNQKLAILEFAQREKFEVDDYVEITVSSRKSTKERKIDLLLEKLETGHAYS
jgi:DNA invertase Pin-like site-specific DNA recombinase